MSTLLEQALEYAAKGWPVFPCRPGSKEPATAHGFHDATTNPLQIETWWKENPDYNIAFRPGAVGLCVIDIDQDTFLDFPPTYEVKTPRGGRHLYYEGHLPESQSRLAFGIDTRGDRGYALLPPSQVAGRCYEVSNDIPFGPVPSWVSDRVCREPRAPGEAVPDADQNTALHRAGRWLNDLLRRGDDPIRGPTANTRTFQCLAKLRDLGVPYNVRGQLLIDIFKADEAYWDKIEEINEHVEQYALNRDAGTRAVQASSTVFGSALALLAERSPEMAEVVEANTGPISASDLANGDFKPTEYLIADLIMENEVNLLYGDGGTGKTILAEHMAVAIAAGLPDLFGKAVRQRPCLAVLCEDGKGETKRRLQQVCLGLGVKLDQLPLQVWCEPDDPLMSIIDDKGLDQVGPFFEPLCKALMDMRGGFLILDTVSDIAALDETKRLPVNALCKRVLRGLCRTFGVTILVNAHPSKKAMEDGTHYAGSTAWNNSVHNRLSLTRVKDAERTDSRRVLRVEKTNYGTEQEVELRLSPMLTFKLDTAPQEGEYDLNALVLAEILALLEKDIPVAKVSHGSGHGPDDIAASLNRKHKIKVNKHQVREAMLALESAPAAKIRYVSRPAPATYLKV